MTNPIVEHLREHGPRPASSARWRRALVLFRTRRIGRTALSLVAAFVCGVVLGVGVAALITPQRAEILASAGKPAATGAAEAPYAVAVRVREEGAVQPEAGRHGQQIALAVPPPSTPPTISLPSVALPAAAPSLPPVGTPHVQVPLPAETPPAPAAGYVRPPTSEDRRATTRAPVAAVPEAVPAADPAPLGGMVEPPAQAAPEAAPAPEPLPLPAAEPATKNLELAGLPMPGDPAWIRNAIKLPDTPRDAAIAIIIDDMGIDQKRSRLVIGLPAPLTLSFIPYGYHLKELTAAARAAGHEVMLHMPMEPLDAEADPGPNALRTTVSLAENRRRLLWAFSRFDGIVGLSNHMGSKFTTWQPGMEMVIQEVRSRGLLFVDSITSNESVGYRLAHGHKLPAASRDVFIDHDITTVAIKHSLDNLERIARQRGYAVGIGHPHDLTREMLKQWIAEARARGIDFVPISYIVQRSMKTG